LKDKVYNSNPLNGSRNKNIHREIANNPAE
jgi:hypothetical protein